MKRILSTALFLQLLMLALAAPAIGANQRREFISKTMNSDVQKLLENCSRELIGAEPFSSKNNDVTDYMIAFYDTDHGLLVMLHTLKQRLDESGRAIPVPALIAEAVDDALAPFGVRVREMPLDPGRVRALIAARRRGEPV